MLFKSIPPEDRNGLRARAVSHLRGGGSNADIYAEAPDALRVLHDLASSPATAGKALALLHELQVHQVEVDLQDEELRRTRAEMEVSLARQIQLYDAAPVAYLSIEPDTTLCEANLTAERVFGLARERLLGRALESFLLPQTRAVLHGMLEQLLQGSRATAHGALRLMGFDGAQRFVHASVSRDPLGERFLVALAETSPTPAV
jgi:PAS domain S-box-containing protein